MGQNPNRAVLGPIDRLFRSGTAAGLTDGQLLERFATRHDEAAEAAFAALVERHGPMVLNVCRGVLHDPHDAQDAFQATFLVLVRKAAAVRRRESVAAWLHGVARRVSAHARASAARRRRVEGAIPPRSAVVSDAHAPGGEVWEEVDRLPADLRAAVVLCYLEGQTHEQAAGRLGWPVGTVRSRLARARDRLRTRLRRRGLHPDAALLSPLTLKPAALPANLIGPVVKAAMLVAARDGVDAGLVSASAAALSEGVLRTMFITQCKSAALALLAAGVVATGASVYAYQDAAPAQTAPAAADLAAPPQATNAVPAAPRPVVLGHGVQPPQATPAADPARPARVDSEIDAAHARMLSAFAFKMEALVKSARKLQDERNHQAAARTTREMEQLCAQWRQSLGETLAVVVPNPQAAPDEVVAQEHRRAAERLHSDRARSRFGPDGPQAPGSDVTARRPSDAAGATPPNVGEWGGYRRAVKPGDPSTVNRTPVELPVDNLPQGTAERSSAGGKDTDRRLDEVERKLDRILRKLEGDHDEESRGLDPGSPPADTTLEGGGLDEESRGPVRVRPFSPSPGPFSPSPRRSDRPEEQRK